MAQERDELAASGAAAAAPDSGGRDERPSSNAFAVAAIAFGLGVLVARWLDWRDRARAAI